ncbi:signal recognition particle protein [Thermodesulforhabdus norvegica]|uniref:Signal recognition particle protein n=1 Tax=Thermodesulforhabdus norvegica TaxID=39841 RepID=A0A1I4R009_9BACT|nr:signal recognition particle protein [Thermodesulforhabdus norvegica]SFM45290.1 signal recognition particle subunit FFH/SRP54 (srp54) [Thermodesulforhabdus norvegica]
MFENLTARFEKVFRFLKGQGKLTEANIKEALREVRLALLEADVNYRVVKDFVSRIQERAVGQEVMSSLTPGQQVIKIVHEELIKLLGEKAEPLSLKGPSPVTVLLVGLQGSGKTTTAAKLALKLKKDGRHPCLVPADVYRPAAIEQLRVLAGQVGVPCYEPGQGESPESIVKAALNYAGSQRCDTLIVDTAGRLHIDRDLMEELRRLKQILSPEEILLVVDAMTGQDAVNVAEAFHKELSITGVILTKLDGDARGGAALSVRAVTGCPIKFVGVGEKLDALEIFHPDRMSSRILGMGDILSAIEKAQEAIDQEEAERLFKKLQEDSFTLEDFRDQLRQLRRLGSLDQILKLLPGTGMLKELRNMHVDMKELIHAEAIINSMTKEERRKPEIINASRKRRIARGSGTSVQEVNRVLRSFEQMRKMMRQMVGTGRSSGTKAAKKKKRRAFFPF